MSIITIPNLITLCRIASLPFLVHAMMFQQWSYALALLCSASLTDVLDGLIARSYQMTSVLGSALDPLADKLLVAVFYSVCVYQNLLPAWFVVAVIFKEIMLILGALILFIYKKKLSRMYPTWQGKAAMLCHVLLMILVLTCRLGWTEYVVVHVVMASALVLSYWALIRYGRAFFN